MTIVFVFWQPLRDSGWGKLKWQKTARFKGPCKPIGEVEINRISENGAIIAGILHRKSKGEYFEVFRY